MNKRPPPPEGFDENPVWTEEMLIRARPASEVHGLEIAATMIRKRGRPALAAGEHKQKVTMRLSPDVLEALRQLGPGWHAGAEIILRKGLGLTDKAPRARSRSIIQRIEEALVSSNTYATGRRTRSLSEQGRAISAAHTTRKKGA